MTSNKELIELADICERATGPDMRIDVCPACGVIEPKKLSQRTHKCDCGYTEDRDIAAAQVILHRAVHGPGAANAGKYAERSRGKVAA